MQRVNEFAFYELAKFVHPLTKLAQPVNYAAVWSDLWDARRSLDNIAQARPLSVSRQAAIDLYHAINQVVPNDLADAIGKITPPPKDAEGNEGSQPNLPYWEINSIVEAAKRFETVLAEEVATLDTYFVEQKGTNKTQDMIERAEIMFPEVIRVELPATTREDIKAAGRCFVLDCPTAAGFHLMRAVESVMAIYYAETVGKQIPVRMRNWGIYIRALRDSGKANPKIVEMLQHVKDQYRNPTLHPDVLLVSDEVDMLIGVVKSLIGMMLVELKAKAMTAATAGTP